ncbi:hypothetical protein BofuT4_uP043150.1 [Botrytis cinerea T4]|uniref:Uncharacterized protein n=1 Tax=Botryotinia fuckeliana (strain T4) TaxID=999810 RepID=G2Y214_BOTF4|nr:hypothetical protein BofuT4_uP043150.1 [Botrytis cinerea T4]
MHHLPTIHKPIHQAPNPINPEKCTQIDILQLADRKKRSFGASLLVSAGRNMFVLFNI